MAIRLAFSSATSTSRPNEPDSRHRGQDSYELPVDVQVLGSLRHHAHYLGKDLRGFARLPDGTDRRP